MLFLVKQVSAAPDSFSPPPQRLKSWISQGEGGKGTHTSNKRES